MQHTPTPRRVFMMQMAVAGTALMAASGARAATHVEESDENAVALGYKHDTTKVDTAKFPQHTKDQHCAGCQFWQGSKTDEWGGCSMFGRKHVNAKGWCAAYRKV